MAAAELTAGRPPLDLSHLAESIAVPLESRGAVRAYVETVRVGPDYRHQVYFGLDAGRHHSAPVGTFATAREAVTLAAILNGRRAAVPSASNAPADGPPRPTAAPEPVPTAPVLPPDLAKALGAGKFEQTCRTCGRWEAAGYTCSWCGRPMGEVDWYRNGAVAERRACMPAVAPADPPIEYRAGAANWPAAWGPFPRRQKLGREPGTPIERAIAEPVDVRAAQPSPQRARPSAAGSGQLALGLIPNNETAAAHVIAAAKPEVHHDRAAPTP